MDNLSKLEREFWPKRITLQITTVEKSIEFKVAISCYFH